MKFTAIAVAMALLGLSSLLSASADDDGSGVDEASESTASGETIVRWNNNAVTALDGVPPDQFVRTMAIAHVAMHDAANVVRALFNTYALDRDSIRNLSSADPSLAAASAAHDVLVSVRPEKQAQIDAMLQPDIDAAKPGTRAESLEIGAAAARVILSGRAKDGANTVVPHTFGPAKPGAYQSVPPLGPLVVGTQLPFLRPFVLSAGNQFRPKGPPDLATAEWASDYNEVKAYGRADSTVRTSDQTDAARFFFEFTYLQWNRIARTVATRTDKGLWTTARVFALMNVSLVDVAIATFDSKYHYNFWRPYTAIRAGDTDGNPNTDPDSKWTPLGATPPHPEYLAGHASLSAAASVALTAIYGRNVAFSTTSTTSPSTRSYGSFDDAVLEGAHSRIWAGFHYRSSVEEGMVQGYEVGKHVMANAFQQRAKRGGGKSREQKPSRKPGEK